MAKAISAKHASHKGTGVGGKKAPMAAAKGRSRVPLSNKNREADGEEGARQRKKKKSVTDLRSFVFKLFRSVSPGSDYKVSRDAINVLNQMLIDLVERIGDEGSHLCKYSKKDIMQVREMQTAMRLVIPTQELLSYALKEGDLKVRKWQQSRAQSSNEE